MTDDGDGDDVLLDTAFGVNKDDVGDYKSDEVPVNGHQYLHKVMKEAEKLPMVVVADVNRTLFDSKQTFYVPEEKRYDVSRNFLPSKVWQEAQMQDFERLRQQVEKMRSRLPELNTYEVLDVDDSDEDWYNFVWDSEQKEPVLQLMLAFKQVSLDRLLNLFVTWVEDQTVELDRRTSLWIYSVLACLDIPLSPSTFSAIRSLAQMAGKQRALTVQSKENLSEQDVSHLSLIICIVGRYFRQSDLADPF
ncbi:Survival motor neuron (SMN) interacting protein 1 (SIP1) [Nesidiocoris tenuis]|uniref:Gem-associated protein 2 n=1 Tax=Nesidiocoris tenuis TaxID=355587 RepID=A0ABN7BDD2_9HEMI|nr:Survival motor neuron (SMN) interacting protein 1 (SIP1) [Nesidiocoris tenuis]